MEFIISFCLIICLLLLLFTGKISYKITQTNISLFCTYWFSYVIEFNDIISVKELNDFNSYGIRLCGLGNLRCGAGLFHNKVYGNYTLYSDFYACKHIELKTKEDKVIIIGLKDEKQLEDLLIVLNKRVLI